MNELADGIQQCGYMLIKWNKEVFSKVEVNIKQKERELNKILSKKVKTIDMKNIERCQRELKYLWKQKEVMWKQRAKSLWLKEGDRNTSYFHGVASKRRRNNRILKIKDEDGRWKESKEEIEQVFLKHFSKIFTTSDPGSVDNFLKDMDRRVSEEMNIKLDKPFLESEIKMAIDQMNPQKSPGPDGMTACFYQ